jgi:GntR family transcriptional regulator, trigonelline degradation regulator
MADVEPDDALRIIRAPVLVRQLAADTLRNAIVSGSLKAGERLVESTLAKRLGVSRPSVREAITQLAAEKLVTMTPNRGPAVATISWAEAQHIYAIRALLEPEAAAQCALRATKAQIAQMRRALKEFERAIPKHDVAKLLSTTMEFYDALIEGCGNPIIGEVLHGLNARVSMLRARSMSRPGRPPHSLAEMGRMLEAVERRDAEGAREVSLQHVERASAAARQAEAERAAQAAETSL